MSKAMRGSRLTLLLAAGLVLATPIGEAQAQAFEENPPPLRSGPQRAVLEEMASESVEDASDEALGVALRGLVIRDSAPAADVPLVEGVATTFPLPEGVLLADRLAPFIGAELSMRRIAEIRAAILDAYREAGRGFVAIVVAPQDISEGVLQITVNEFFLGEKRVEGLRFSDDAYILGAVRATPGEAIDTGQLVEDLNWLNRNPYRNLTLVAEPGKEFGETRFLLRADERPPWTVFAEYNNSGTEETGAHRFVAGFHAASLFSHDNQLSYQYTTSSHGPFSVYGDVGANDKGYSSHDGYYLILTPWRHRLRLRAAYIQSRADLADPLVSASDTLIASAIYTVPLGRFADAALEAYAQVDYKYSSRDLFFNGVFATNAQFGGGVLSLGLKGSREGPSDRLSFDIRAAHSPGGIGPDSDDAAAAAFANAPNATADFSYVYGSAQYAHRLTPVLDARVSGGGQASTDQLPSTEGFSLGGMETARGYAPLEASGDDGVWLQGEIGAELAPFLPDGVQDHLRQGRVYAFADAGYVHDRATDADESLVGVGLGATLAIGRHAVFDGAIGYALSDGPETEQGGVRGHISINLHF